MAADVEQLRPSLQEFDFRGLFIEGLGWNFYEAEIFSIRVNNHEYSLNPVAEKAGFAVFECNPDADGLIPAYPIRRKIEHQVAKRAFEHLIVFVDAQRTIQIWQWVKREPGKSAACREQKFHQGQRGDPLLQRISQIAFSLNEEPNLNISAVASRVRKALDVERVTKRFYEHFRKELNAFGSFVEGITSQGDRDWYASLMLNRMMFVYFVQKQGFLDANVNYLRDRLNSVREHNGGGRFQQFYRMFLLRLFHEGLGQPEAQRAPDLAALLGKVPFLNGGLFDVHDLERVNPGISIPDEAFERVFDFFDSYRWHLDERPYREDNEINPDILGYIFEKYVNQKQMGAYYTKEDITGYISRNTVIPFLFDAARKECPVAFTRGGGVWGLLRDDPDRYIYPAVAHGVTWNAREAENPMRLNTPFDLPRRIAVGINDVSQRGSWNDSAPDDYALPTETWREIVARRQRHAQVRAKLAKGKVHEINDLITLNLDIEQFAKDVIAQSEGPELLRAFWHAVRDVSVLDPTCGSGAFLFAALNVLEPLYTACLEGMRGFLDDLKRTKRPHHPEVLRDFRDILHQVDKHPSERYFILKSIVLNNLYGVDIMEEAVEICKLRLFLKLVAQLESYDQVEPLPDIDFNIRSGNTLVGFISLDAVRQAMTATPDGQRRALFDEDLAALARIEEEAEVASRAFDLFRKQQTSLGGEVTAQDKSDLRQRLESLDKELDRYLASEYGVDVTKPSAYAAWQTSHQPFHWFVEFYRIMSGGGFDVVIGNPPYVRARSIKYSLRSTAGQSFPDIYAYVLIQSLLIRQSKGRCGFIVPLSICFSRAFRELRQVLTRNGSNWLSSYDNIPAALFSGVGQRCAIWMNDARDHTLQTTRLYRWRASYRPNLLSNVTYVVAPDYLRPDHFGIPRLSNDQEKKLLRLHVKTANNARQSISDRHPESQLGFSPTARNFISAYVKAPPVLNANDRVPLNASSGAAINLRYRGDAFTALAATAGDVFFWYWLVRGDGFHVTNWLISDFLGPVGSFPTGHLERLSIIGKLLHKHRHSALVFKKNAGKYVGNYNYQRLSELTRKADLVFLSALGAKWLDARDLFSFVSLVRSINESAGERNIPTDIKGQFPAVNPDILAYDEHLLEIGDWLCSQYEVSADDIISVVRA